MTPRHHRRACSGFSLLEILVVIVIVGILTALLVPAIGRQIENSRAASCVTKLKQISAMFSAYAADNNMKVSFMRDGKTSRAWYTELRSHAGLSETMAKKTFGCPSLPWEGVNHTACYGFRVGSMPPVAQDPGKVVRDDETGFYELSLLKVQEPSRFFIMGDTGTSKGQTFRIIPPGLYASTGIKTRHRNRANILFLDGHVEALGSEGLKEIGITDFLNAEGVPTQAGN